MNVNLKSLVGRLNDVCRNALESAAGLCLSRTNYDVEIEHVPRHQLAVRPRRDIVEAGEVHVRVAAGHVGVVVRIAFPGMALEPELVAVVVEGATNVVDQQDGRVVAERGASPRTQSGRLASRARSAIGRRSSRPRPGSR